MKITACYPSWARGKSPPQETAAALFEISYHVIGEPYSKFVMRWTRLSTAKGRTKVVVRIYLVIVDDCVLALTQTIDTPLHIDYCRNKA